MEPKQKCIYPKENTINNPSTISKKNTIKECIQNPYINHINFNSLFIFDHFDYIRYFNFLQNKNRMKLSEQQLLFLKEIYRENIQLKESFHDKDLYLTIDETIFEQIKNYNTQTKPISELSLYLKNKILESKNRSNLSCRKLANDYYQNTGKKVGKTTVNNILKKELGFRYLKTTLKNNNLKKESGILDCFGFVKAFTKCLELRYNPIFLDESKIELINNHYKCWRYSSEEIYFGNSSREKNNLILAVGIDKIFHYSLKIENTDAKNFLEFLKELIKILSNEKNKKFIIVMDNLTCHKKKEVITFLVNSKINVIFNARYMSSFNAVELAFRAIKKQIYSNIYNSMDEIKSDIINYLGSKKIKETLISNYCETIGQYISYSEKNQDINLNNFSCNI